MRACVFDLDGVVSKTDFQHRQAWKRTFDEWDAASHQPSVEPFSVTDYLEHVDGLPKESAVRSFLASRAAGPASDDECSVCRSPACRDRGRDSNADPDPVTVRRLVQRKSALYEEAIRDGFVEAYPGTVVLLRALRECGVATAVVSASTHCARILDTTGLRPLFDVLIDRTAATRRALAGKPSPDTFLAAARDLDVPPGACCVFEDGPSGLRAAVAGGFGRIVAVDRCGRPDVLLRCGAHQLVHDLGQLVPPILPTHVPDGPAAPHATS
ncbi:MULTISPECIES: HAD family hydrolase [unclassified Streptomyces]|uniref:HAD family hydrolase n=1 Tax=Streptomyces sp. NPDC007872 TaxID=3364782 RepID=UPI00367EBBC7